MWDWFPLVERGDGSDTAAEVTYPKRLLQQMKSGKEMAHGYLSTRAKNSSSGGDTSVSFINHTSPGTVFVLI